MSMLLALATAALGATFMVDDDGPASFSTIGAAIAAASDGDMILVEPGTYPPFALPKQLRILGRASGAGTPTVTGHTTVTSVGGFTVAGLAWPWLPAEAVRGAFRHIGVQAAHVQDKIGEGFARRWRRAQGKELERVTGLEPATFSLEG